MATPTSPFHGKLMAFPKELYGPVAETQTEETFDNWMASGWKNPEDGDAINCCLAFWAPWVMYGKTHWRLKQVVRGEDPQDSAWKSNCTCNEACWAMGALDCISLLYLGFVPIAFERSRIRHTYGIKGTLSRDWALAFCCRPCTLLQNDREVRAREGNCALIVNPNYNVVKEKPVTKPPMSYRPQNGMATAPVVQDDRVTLPLDDTPAREQVLMSGDGTVSPGGDTQELYYMHDFTDTAIDRSIIEYRERQGPDYKDTNRGATNRVTFAEGSRHSVNPWSGSKATIIEVKTREPSGSPRKTHPLQLREDLNDPLVLP